MFHSVGAVLDQVDVPFSGRSFQFQSLDLSSELFWQRLLHKLIAIWNHHIHLARLCSYDVNFQGIRAEEHLAAISFVNRDGWNRTQDLQLDKTDGCQMFLSPDS